MTVDNPVEKQAIMAEPTIAAIATPIGRGGIGVIRLSGGAAYSIAQALTQSPNTAKPLHFRPRQAQFCRFYAADGSVIDEGLVLYFAAPNSFTGEDVIELQGHGGVVLQQQLLLRVFALGATQAAAGEFSARAFANDKLDLVQAEAIADAIDATSVAAAKSAMRSLSGEFSHRIHDLLGKLIHLRLHVEAAIDFPDEEDVDFLADGQIAEQLHALQTQLNAVLASTEQGQLLRDGVAAVIAGRPNAGKSSLLNRLAGQERAIVTDVAGTTRDILQETVIIDGLKLNLTDTAGLRDTADHVEQIGIARAHNAIAQADMVLLVYDVSQTADPLALARELLGELPSAKRLLLIGNKADLLSPDQQAALAAYDWQGYAQVTVSCATGVGLNEFSQTLRAIVGFHPAEGTWLARARHLDALRRVQTALIEADTQLHTFHAGELVAESLRQAQQALGEITGEFSADDLLGQIFGSFCIGK